jgi:hypothetical protein
MTARHEAVPCYSTLFNFWCLPVFLGFGFGQVGGWNWIRECPWTGWQVGGNLEDGRTLKREGARRENRSGYGELSWGWGLADEKKLEPRREREREINKPLRAALAGSHWHPQPLGARPVCKCPQSTRSKRNQ